LFAILAAALGSVSGVFSTYGAGLAVAAVGAIGLVSGFIMIFGSIMINSGEKSKVKTGSILVLVFTLIGAIFTFGGFAIGFILALIGSILGLTWKPSTTMPPPPVPPS